MLVDISTLFLYNDCITFLMREYISTREVGHATENANCNTSVITTIDFKRFVPYSAHILISQKQHKKGLMP